MCCSDEKQIELFELFPSFIRDWKNWTSCQKVKARDSEKNVSKDPTEKEETWLKERTWPGKKERRRKQPEKRLQQEERRRQSWIRWTCITRILYDFRFSLEVLDHQCLICSASYSHVTGHCMGLDIFYNSGTSACIHQFCVYHLPF